jgi:type II secretory ATPase GspE/PulE/Tfp pilus assembly ATPase PilB-like protein
VRAALNHGLLGPQLQAVAVNDGMRTLRDRCLDLVREGVTTFDEFSRLRL